MIVVTGSLTTPMNNPLVGAVIRATSLKTVESIVGSQDAVTTSETGSYSFSLVQGDHEIELVYLDEFITTGSVTIPSNAAGSVDLETLLTTFIKES